MDIVNTKKLWDFAKKLTDAGKSLSAWKIVTEKANWDKSQDILDSFPNAKVIKGNRARFKIYPVRFGLADQM